MCKRRRSTRSTRTRTTAPELNEHHLLSLVGLNRDMQRTLKKSISTVLNETQATPLESMADRAEVAHQCAASASLASSLSDVHVLVVDDEPLSRTIVGNLLRKCDYQVTMVESASEAIRVLDENGSQFDLVLTDVMMPDVGGIGVSK